MPREENLAAYKAQRKTKPKTKPVLHTDSSDTARASAAPPRRTPPRPHTDSADTARRRGEIQRQVEADRQAEMRRRIPTATTAKPPRRKPMTRDDQLALAVDLAMRREPAFKKSARNTRLSSFAQDWVFGKTLSEPGFDPRDPAEWAGVATLLPVAAGPLAAGRIGARAAMKTVPFKQANKALVQTPAQRTHRYRWPRRFRKSKRFFLRNAPAIGAAEVLSQPEFLGSLLRVVQGRGTKEDYRRLAIVAAQAGGTGALLRQVRRTPEWGKDQIGPWIGDALMTLHRLGDDDD